MTNLSGAVSSGTRGVGVAATSAPMAPAPLDASVLRLDPDGPRLIGSECARCATISFPASASCPRCTATDTRERLLGTRGVLWSWTVQAVRPKSPPYSGADDERSFVPFGVGYVELPGELRIESRLTLADPAKLRIGMQMKLVTEPYPRADSEPAVTFAFAPIEEVVE